MRACLLFGSICAVVGCSEGAAPTPLSPSVAGAGAGAGAGNAGQSAAGSAGAVMSLGGAGSSAGSASGGTGSDPNMGGVAPVGGSTGQATIGAIYCPTRPTRPTRPAATGPYPNPLADTPQASVVSIDPPGGISFLEGPVWLAERGVLLLSEWNQGHRILQLTPPQAVEVFLPSSRTNGLVVTPDAQSLLVVTEAPSATLSQINLSNKGIEPLVEDYEGESFVQPNDLAVRADGTTFFTDYQAGRLYRRAADGSVALVASMPHSNGVGISPDETTLYLNSDALTVEYPLSPDSDLGEGSNLTAGLSGADGLAIDCAGNVYIAQNQGGALVVVAPSGQRLGEIGDLPEVVTNAAFGGSDRQTLYITTNSALYAVALPVPGLPY